MPVFPVSCSKIQILRRCSKKLCRRVSARLQLLEALLSSLNFSQLLIRVEGNWTPSCFRTSNICTPWHTCHFLALSSAAEALATASSLVSCCPSPVVVTKASMTLLPPPGSSWRGASICVPCPCPCSSSLSVDQLSAHLLYLLADGPSALLVNPPLEHDILILVAVFVKVTLPLPAVLVSFDTSLPIVPSPVSFSFSAWTALRHACAERMP